MGQARSCIQGSPDWAGAYEKPSQKPTVENRDIYSRLGELVLLSSITKDYSALEQFLADSRTSDQSSIKSTALAKEKTITNSEVPNSTKTKSTPLKLEEIFYKATQCKSVNFSQEQNLSKTTSVKPVIVKKKCKVHGQGHGSTHIHNMKSSQQHHHQPGCPLSSKPSNIIPSYPSPPPYSEIVKSNRIPHQPVSTMVVKPTIKDHSIKNDTIPNAATPTASTSPRVEMSASLPKKIPSAAKNSSNESFPMKVDFSTANALWKIIPFEDEKKPESDGLLAALAVHAAKETIQRLEDRGETIVETFGVVLKHMEHGDWSTFCISTSRLCDDIRKILRDNNISSSSEDPMVIKIANRVTSALNELTAQILQSNLVNSTEQPNLLPSFRKLGEVLHELMEFLISKELTIVVKSLGNKTSDYCVKEALLALAEMTMSGPLMGKLITQVGAVKALSKICEQDKCLNLKLLAMRTLTALCNNPAAVICLEKVAGLPFIIKTLSMELDQNLRNEALALLTQVLNHINSQDSVKQTAQQYACQLVKILIDLAQKTLSAEAYLLTASSLASLSAFNEQASEWTSTHDREIKHLLSISWTESYV